MINDNITDFSNPINATPRSQPKIYIACLASHSNGEAHGEWVDANQSVEALKRAAQRMLISRLAAFLIKHGEWGAILMHHFNDDLNLASLEKADCLMTHGYHGIKKPGSKRSDQLIDAALLCLEARFHREPKPLRGLPDIKNYLRLQLAEEKNEVFAILFFDIRYRLLSFDKLFQGTIDQAQVYKRVIFKKHSSITQVKLF